MKRKNAENRINRTTPYPRIVAIGFLLLIAVGTILLMLPMSSKSGTSAGFIDSLFTATSASCVTGLIIGDTFTKWTLFGQVVILAIIQIGGLGFITIVSTAIRFVRKTIGLKEKILLKESVSALYYEGVSKLAKKICFGTAFFEIVGAIILYTRFSQSMNFKNALFTSVFLSISAFCNAGFDILGRITPGGSLTVVNSDPIILVTISLLIIVGGIGFVVWDDISKNKFKFKSYMLYTKLVLIFTAILLVGGTVLFLVFEHNNTLSNMNVTDTIANAFFCSVTPRTAGFNSVDTASLTSSSKFLTMVLMLIGGSSGSTAGGVKTVTVFVLILAVTSAIKNKDDIQLFGKRIEQKNVKKANAVVVINLAIIFISTLIITNIQTELGFTNVLFECFSALGTVGMTCGITSSLGVVSKIIITLLMFIGRLSSMTFALLFISTKNNSSSLKPVEKIIIG